MSRYRIISNSPLAQREQSCIEIYLIVICFSVLSQFLSVSVLFYAFFEDRGVNIVVNFEIRLKVLFRSVKCNSGVTELSCLRIK